MHDYISWKSYLTLTYIKVVSEIQTRITTRGQLILKILSGFGWWHLSADLSRWQRTKKLELPKPAKGWNRQPSVLAVNEHRSESLFSGARIFKQVILWKATAGILHPAAGCTFQSHRVKEKSCFDINIHKVLGPPQPTAHLSAALWSS